MSESDVTSTVQTTTITDPTSIAAQNRGPITSLYRPPSSCTATLTTQQQGDGTGLFFGHSWDPYYDASCLPLGTLSAEDLASRDGPWDYYYYSPAICPQGWKAATTFTSDIPGHLDNVFIYRGSETTVALCCPSGYGYVNAGHLCSSILSADQRVLYVRPKNTGNGWDRGTASTTTIASQTTVYGDGVQVWWQSSDEAILSAAMSASPTTEVVTEAGPTTSVVTMSVVSSKGRSAPSNTSSPSSSATGESTADDGGGLTTGAKAGIGAGIGAFVLIAGAAAAFFLLRRRKRASKSDMDRTPELAGFSAPQLKSMHYAMPTEIAGRSVPAELH